MRGKTSARPLAGRRSLMRWCAAALVAAWSATPGARAAEVAPPETYSVEVVLAPVCLEGTFPATIQRSSGPLPGTLRLDTDLRGRLTGELTADGRTLPLTGHVTYGPKGTTASFTARSGADRITFSGKISGTTLSGRTTGKGQLAPGRRAFTADLTGAGPATAQLDCALTVAANGRIRGSARVVACGQTVDLRVAGTSGRKRYALVLSKGRLFRFSGRAGGGAGLRLLDWTARGFGARARGLDAPLDPLAAPDLLSYPEGILEFETEAAIAPVEPVTVSAPRAVFTISPDLPAGLLLDAESGVVAGAPEEIRGDTVYSVTATNYAGSVSAQLGLRTRIPRAKSFAPELRALSDDDLRHFLERTQYGAPGAQLASLRSKGLDQYLDDMLVFSMTGPAEAVAAPELLNASDPVGFEGMFPSQTQLARWWSNLLVHTDNPFQERLAFFWADHFAVGAEVFDGGDTHFMREYVDLYRRQGAGNLRTLLVDMARSPAMLKYLDGYRSTARAPNENFGREFWELFTLGADNGYTQEDIVEAARAFTGWRFTTDATTGLVTASFVPSRHDATSKTVLGVTIPGQAAGDDYQAMVDATLDHRPVAEYLVRRLFEHFAYAAPPQPLVDDMARTLRDADHELAPFLRALFRSEAFFSARSRRALVKSPVDFGIGFVRTTGLETPISTLTSQLTTLGQCPTQPPTVNGWPQGDLWFSAQNMADRANLVYSCVEDTTRQRTAGIEIAAILPPSGQRSAGEVVDAMAALLKVPLTAAERQSCVDYLNSTRQSNGTYSYTVPFDGSIQSHLDERVRGLVYVLAQHPDYQLR